MGFALLDSPFSATCLDGNADIIAAMEPAPSQICRDPQTVLT